MSNHIGESPNRKALRKLLRRKDVAFSLCIVALYLLVAICGYLGLIPDFQERVGGSYEPPTLELAKIFGTDIFGRSVLYKIIVGTKTAVTISALVTCIAIPIGIFMGAISGYYGGKVDAIVVWCYSVIVSVPYILLIIAISYLLGKGLVSISIAMGAVVWVTLCRLIRGEFIKHKDRDYVLASRLVGAKDGALIFRHILPNTMHLAIISASIMSLQAMMSEVVLTFLGVGIQNGASWGTMISDATGELVNGIWWPLAGVTLALFTIACALNIVGDALRDALDPKLG